MKSVLAVLCAILPAIAWGGEQPAPKFTKKPTAVRAGAKIRIEFAVDRETDVAVFIDGANGKVVRHLVAGMLGKNAPKPLKPGLAQSITWDGKADYGKAAAGGPFKVRVALGVGAKYEKVLMRDEQTLHGIKGITVAPDGTLYVAETIGGAVWRNTTVIAFTREGKYARTVHPFPTSLPMEKVKDLTAFELKGHPAPLITNHILGLGSIPGFVRKTPMAVTPDGKAMVWLSKYTLAMLGTDGSAVGKPGVGGFTNKAHPADKDGKFRGSSTNWPAMALSSDGKYAYVAGFKPNRYKKTENACVLRVPLSTRKGEDLFFGDWIKTGKSDSLLAGAPHGLATDGKGKLYIADTGNNRVLIVSEKTRKLIGQIKVTKPHYLAANPKNGNVYVTSWSGRCTFELLKLSGGKEGKVLARMPMRWRGNPSYPPLIALDHSGSTPIVWLAGESEGLIRLVDRGSKFESKTVSTRKDGAACYLDVSVDRWRADREIYTRCGVRHDWWYRYNEDSGKIDRVVTPGKYVGGIGMGMRPAPDGFLYGLWYPYHMYKHDRSGKRVPFTDPRQPPAGQKWGKGKAKLDKNSCYVPNSESALTHGIGVRSDGHIFTLEPRGPGGRPPKFMHEYLPTGKRISKDPILWKTSDAALGPYFDANGNIYIAEYVKPKDWPYPPEFKKQFGPIKSRLRGGPQHVAANMYGSIVKFSPKGGMVHVPVKGGVDSGPDPFDGKPKLDGMKSKEYAYYHTGLMRNIKVTGAEWVHPGISHVGVFRCTCENITMDVDEFGRVWFPDANLYQVRVIDTNGNRITEFGSYGNADSCGPDSKDKQLARPEIAFAWLVGVAVTDKYIYTGDSINRRMLKIKMTYQAEESCAVR
jgi:DNA-binding beta-propeller fold protein YncE